MMDFVFKGEQVTVNGVKYESKSVLGFKSRFESLVNAINPGRFHTIFDQCAYDLYQYKARDAGETGKKYKDLYLSLYRKQIRDLSHRWVDVHTQAKQTRKCP